MRKSGIFIGGIFIAALLSQAFAQDTAPAPRTGGKLRVVDLKGTPYERGLIHGRTLKKDIETLVGLWKDDLEKTYEVPAAAYIDKLLETTDFKPAIERWTPGLLDEVRGIADGAGVDFDTMYAYQLIDECWVLGRDLGFSKCTTFGVRPRAGSPALVAQTLDIPAFYHGFQTVLRIEGDGGEPSALVFTIPGVLAANGLNDRGIGVCVNAVGQLAHTLKGLPVDFIVRGILRQRTYKDAVRFLKDIKPAAPQNYVIGGPEEIGGYERSADRTVAFLPFPAADFTYHTNHPVVNDDLDPPFVKRLKKRGETMEAYRARCGRFRYLAASFKDNASAPDAAALERLFADRPSGINNDITYGCTIMILGARPELRISPGRPDLEPFVTLGFGR
jgi:hypothetical protein